MRDLLLEVHYACSATIITILPPSIRRRFVLWNDTVSQSSTVDSA